MAIDYKGYCFEEGEERYRCEDVVAPASGTYDTNVDWKSQMSVGYSVGTQFARFPKRLLTQSDMDALEGFLGRWPCGGCMCALRKSSVAGGQPDIEGMMRASRRTVPNFIVVGKTIAITPATFFPLRDG